jgi:hypothetical protein
MTSSSTALGESNGFKDFVPLFLLLLLHLVLGFATDFSKRGGGAHIENNIFD